MSLIAEQVTDDGLPCNPAGGWAEEKYRLLTAYIKQFTTGTKVQWPHRTYIDLYSGPGYNKLKDGRVLKGSPIIALSATDPFNQYLFCEGAQESLETLKTRVTRDYPQMNVRYFAGDCDSQIDAIISCIPRRDSLSLCFVDPYNLSIKFETLAKLAERRVDLLCLLALHMDANRAYDVYVAQESSKVDNFLGTSDWRQDFQASNRRREEFPIFLADYFAKRMQSLGFNETPTHSMHLVRSDDRNTPLYHLALFSKSPLAYKFWRQARTSSTPQRGFDFGE